MSSPPLSVDLVKSFDALPGRVPEVMWRERVRLFYKQHNPEREDTVPEVLSQAPGQAQKVFRMLEESYGVRYTREGPEDSPKAADAPRESIHSETSASPLGLVRAGGPRAHGAYRRESEATESTQQSPTSPVQMCDFPGRRSTMQGSGSPTGDREAGETMVAPPISKLAARRQRRLEEKLAAEAAAQG
eukprot:TRINITY_DN66000_c0_g1_i1.p1 TRINITY_DN66000_c0_g1~~TRINITY_DN66000_c0_g1_i1.p1  ORF type:complete len:215 (+),score=41.36 TRINITY_DN66000_c0_g1_i1:82-645(+)